MQHPHLDGLEKALDLLPVRYSGPGGVAGVMLDGRIVARRAWGYRDLTRRLPMQADTRLPICSISKQFTCGVLLAEVPDPSVLDGRVADYLPNFREELPTVRQMCDMQSGLRDYWTLTVLQGAEPEDVFGPEKALPLIARMKTGHFRPGTQYSYCNANFRLLPELLQEKTGQELGGLYRRHLFDAAGMQSAELVADTAVMLDDVVGYEGNDSTGFRQARNRVYWIGDAGINASLDDMLAWEAYIDASLDEPGSLYARLSAQPAFRDGSPAYYGFGLRHEPVAGRVAIGHGGALRGFRAHRLNIASERLSVVVIFNHEADAHGAAVELAEAALGHVAPQHDGDAPGLAGQWLDEREGLLLRLEPAQQGLRLHYGHVPQPVRAAADGELQAPGIVLRREGERMTMTRALDNLAVDAAPLPVLQTADGGAIAGRYRSEELEADLEIESRDGAVFAGFEGLLGTGPMERLLPAGPDVWIMPTRRSLDAPAPGDWTVQVRRDADGKAEGLTVGCWLARRVPYRRVA